MAPVHSQTEPRSAFRRGGFVAFFALALAFLAPVGASAAVTPMTVEELLAVSEDVVSVRVTDVESKPAGGIIMTTAKFQVLESFKGAMAGEQTISYPGGRWRELVMEVPDLPKFQKNEEAILFLRRPDNVASRGGAAPSSAVVGGFQGKLSLRSGEGLMNASRNMNAELPSSLKVVRGASSLETKMDASKAPTLGTVRNALHSLAAAEMTRSSETEFRKYAGVKNPVAVLPRDPGSPLRAFDPLPSMAYATDAQLAEIQKKANEAAEKARMRKQATVTGPSPAVTATKEGSETKGVTP